MEVLRKRFASSPFMQLPHCKRDRCSLFGHSKVCPTRSVSWGKKYARGSFPNVTRQGSSTGKCCPSALRKLRPILVLGLLRIGGRLQNSPLNVDARHPFVLPKRHHVAELIIRHYHLRVGHCGTQYVLAATRERFWIVHGHSTVRHYLKNCQTCLLWKARACGRVMAPLPKCHVTQGFELFLVLVSITLDQS